MAPVATDGLEVVQGKEDIEVVKDHDMRQTSSRGDKTIRNAKLMLGLNEKVYMDQ